MTNYRVHGVVVLRAANSPTITQRRVVDVTANDRRQALIRGKAALEQQARDHTPFTHDEIVATTTQIETLGEAE